MNSKFYDYMAERYPEMSAENYGLFLKKINATVHEYPYGFFIAAPKGDSLIVFDLYTTKEARKTGMAWALFYDIKRLAKRMNKSCILGFSEFGGSGKEHGKGAMTAAGFTHFLTTGTAEVFIKGVN